MEIAIGLAAALLLVCLIVLITAYVCFRMTFYSPKRTPVSSDEYPIPPGKIYEAHREAMVNWTKEIRALPHEEFAVTSFDGLTLRGNYYEYAPGAPIELMFHGYRGTAERDLCGGVSRCFALGRSALLINQRASSISDGSVITFGINEKKDCLSWIDFAIAHFGKDVRLILTGISMGAATVMMAAGEPLPPNVKSVLADCGYTSAREIISLVIRGMHLPPKLFYPFVKLGARLYGHFDLEETSPLEAMKTCRLPIIFVHGESDDFVPCSMSRTLYDACASSRKKLITVPDAGHGLAFPVGKESYIEALRAFEKECNAP